MNNNRLVWADMKSAFKNRVRCGRITNNQANIKDPFVFLNECAFILIPKIGQIIYEYKSPVKMNCTLACEYIIKKGDQIIKSVIHHSTKMKPITLGTDFSEWFEQNVKQDVQKKLDEFQERDSGKALNRVLYLDINISKFHNTKDSCGGTFIPLPKDIQNRKAVINVVNNDDKCFIWSLLAGLYPITMGRNPCRPSSYPQNHEEIFNLKNISFPTPISAMSKFETQNNNISISVYGLEFNIRDKIHEVVGPLYLTPQKRDIHINLLYIKRENNQHYTYIKSLSRLMGSQLSRNHRRKFICERCLQYFTYEHTLIKHEDLCKDINNVKLVLPDLSKKWIKFKNYSNQEVHPFTIYADFESLTTPVNNCQPDPNSSYTMEYQEHIPCAIGYHVVCSYDDSLCWYDSYTGVNPAEWFFRKMQEFVVIYKQIKDNKIPIQMDDIEYTNYENAELCHICGNEFDENSIDKYKVRDHCHFTGKFRGAAHVDCNLNYKIPHFIPIIFHNLSGYDGHILVKALDMDENKVTIIPCNTEKYVSFTKYIDGVQIRFIDSFRFLNSSIDKLTSSLKPEDLRYLRKYFPSDNDFSLITRKGIFPYDYVNSWERLAEQHLPTKNCFYSRLRNEHISNEEYNHAQNVWIQFKHKSLKEYMETYLMTDVLLLSDIFENFRKSCINAYKLDPVYYYTTPGLAWDSMLKMTSIELELLTDVDMLLMFEKGIRGGISQTCNRYSIANNRYMNEHYNPQEEEKFILYLDACNLYGWAMTNYLPHSDFQWMTDTEIDELNILAIPENSLYGYVFEVDLEYPIHLHDMHKDLPLCCEKRTAEGSKIAKLMTTLYDKSNYIIHYRNLQQALQLGLILKNIHRVIKFKQSAWLMQYIDKNTNYRKNALSTFEKNFFKLMNNAIFGKSIESVRKRKDIRLCNKWEGAGGARKLICKQNFHKIDIFHESLVAVEMKKLKIYFNKPIYVGMCILDISKVLMYDFHYNYIHKTYNIPKLLYMDTDSFIYELTNKNPFEQIKIDIDRFDTSDFDLANPYNIPLANKKKVGLFKDENVGKIITEFVALRSKMYNFSLQDDTSNHARAKGISGTVTKNLTMDDYKNVLFHNETNLYKISNRIKSDKHIIFSVEQNKLSLSALDDKRCMVANSTDTLPWGHYSI